MKVGDGSQEKTSSYFLYSEAGEVKEFLRANEGALEASEAPQVESSSNYYACAAYELVTSQGQSGAPL